MLFNALPLFIPLSLHHGTSSTSVCRCYSGLHLSIPPTVHPSLPPSPSLPSPSLALTSLAQTAAGCLADGGSGGRYV